MNKCERYIEHSCVFKNRVYISPIYQTHKEEWLKEFGNLIFPNQVVYKVSKSKSKNNMLVWLVLELTKNIYYISCEDEHNKNYTIMFSDLQDALMFKLTM